MSRGRPHKPKALKDLEGDRGKGRRDAPGDLPLEGFPECPDGLNAVAAEHFSFIAGEFGPCGVLKRVDGAALARLADLWSKYWRASEMWEADPTDKEARQAVIQFGGAWERAAGKLGIPVVDRMKIMAAPQAKLDATEERFFKVTG